MANKRGTVAVTGDARRMGNQAAGLLGVDLQDVVDVAIKRHSHEVIQTFRDGGDLKSFKTFKPNSEHSEGFKHSETPAQR